MASATSTHVRWMIRRDMDRVLDIEQHNFETKFSENDFIQHLRKRNTIGMVCEENDEVIGFMIYELEKKSLYIVSMAVDIAHRRRGIGTRMLGKLKGKLTAHRRSQLQWDVRESNLQGHLFLKSQGFHCQTPINRDYFRDYYDDLDEPSRTEDGYSFVYNHQDTDRSEF